MPAATPTILVADDHPLFREALKGAVARQLPKARLVEADSADALFAIADAHPDADLLLLDLNMPGAHGFSALVHLRGIQPQLCEAYVYGGGNMFPGQFGAGHVGAAIVKVLSTLPCRVLWVDEREDMFPPGLPPQIRIERDYDPSIPEFEMEPDQLQQAFLNIVRNAAEALGDQTGLIRIKTRTAFQITIHGQRYRLAAEIKIIDNGPGIPDAIRDTLFYPMITGKEGGTGLGLSIAQNLIDQHKGRIDCISWPGHTEFTIYLPLRK